MDRCCVEMMSLPIVSYYYSAHMVVVHFRTFNDGRVNICRPPSVAINVPSAPAGLTPCFSFNASGDCSFVPHCSTRFSAEASLDQ